MSFRSSSSSSSFRSGTSSFRPPTSTYRYTPSNRSVAEASREVAVGKAPVTSAKVPSSSIPNRSQGFILQPRTVRPIPYAAQRIQPTESIGTNWLMWYLIFSSMRSRPCVYRPDYNEGGSTGVWSPIGSTTPEATPVIGATPEPEFHFGEHYIATLGCIFALFIFLLVLMGHFAFKSL